jgi:succinoglycan biosynthesis protein ExoW
VDPRPSRQRGNRPGAGYDFYFADHYQLNQTVSAFQRAKRIDVSQHKKITDAEHMRAYSGDMFDQILMGNIIGTSTVVYRFARFPRLRFREEFVYAGEDYLFWLELSALTEKIAFSSMCECTYGAGVNIFAGSGWGTEKSLMRLHYEIKYKKALPNLFKLNVNQLATNRATVKRLRRSFVADLLHRWRHRIPVDEGLLRDQFRIDPQTIILFLPLTAAIILNVGSQ